MWRSWGLCRCMVGWRAVNGAWARVVLDPHSAQHSHVDRWQGRSLAGRSRFLNKRDSSMDRAGCPLARERESAGRAARPKSSPGDARHDRVGNADGVALSGATTPASVSQPSSSHAVLDPRPTRDSRVHAWWTCRRVTSGRLRGDDHIDHRSTMSAPSVGLCLARAAGKSVAASVDRRPDG